ncbi:MAG: hypothetical protein HQM01_11370 [Magnetococcales bacterium]|nr:hypothetical protein [Magnetococcales bacterium]
MIGMTEEEVWDVKEIDICTSRSREDWIKIAVFPTWFSISLEPLNGCGKGHMDAMDLEAAIRLRDFLIYALGSRQMGDAGFQRNGRVK